MTLKSQQRFASQMYNAFTEEGNKISFSANDNKTVKSIDSVETQAYGTSKDLVYEREKIKRNNIMKQYKKWLALLMVQKKT